MKGEKNHFFGKKHTKETILKISGPKHHSWKGDGAKYKAIHVWINHHKGRPAYCEHCDRKDVPPQDYEWANIDHKYRRVLEDWIRLCPKCHSDYDVKMGLRNYYTRTKKLSTTP